MAKEDKISGKQNINILHFEEFENFTSANVLYNHVEVATRLVRDNKFNKIPYSGV